MVEVPSAAQVVVIGGGIIGCSTAYHLTRAGVRDVVLLERHKLTSGTSFHAAGLVGQLRSSANITRLLKYSVELYGRLEAETGQATGFKQNGGLRLACNAERMTEIRRQATTAHSFGLEMHLLGPKEAGELWPIMETKDLVGAAYLPTDGQANPSDLTQALAKGARAEGARIVEGVSVTGIKVVRGRVVGVVTDAGEIACESLVNCAGQWAPGIGRLAGVSVPLSSMQHQYLVTERIEGVEPGLPTLRDPDGLIYFKEDVGGLVMGGYEHRPLPWAEQGIPEGFVFSLLDWNYEQFEPLMESALHRVPKLAEAGVRQFVNGPRVLHAGRQLHPRRGAGPQGLLRRRRLQRLRHRRGRRRRLGAGRVGGARRAADGPRCRRHPPLRPTAPQRRMGACPHRRGDRQALHHGLAA